jgi:serine/threonine protein kinase
MRYYADGDVSHLTTTLQSSYEMQERYFLQMIDCVQELHSRNEFHRDIKPANFLLDGHHVLVSDFGLTTEIGSDTAFTQSSAYWGTHGFIPPEFLDGGFKHADATGDVFMLGKTFYALLTGRDAMYLERQGVPPPVFHIIERCCSISKDSRYRTLADLKQSLVAAYDVLLQRLGGLGRVKQLLSFISEGLEGRGNYKKGEVSEFVEQLALLDEREQIRVCVEIPSALFSVIAQPPSLDSLPTFLGIYEKLVESRDYVWSYAETIAANMGRIFNSDAAPNSERARSLLIAIRAADYMNRFAAMDTCIAIVTSIRDENLGFHVVPILFEQRNTFVGGIEPSACHSDSVAAAIRQIQQEKQAVDGT